MDNVNEFNIKGRILCLRTHPNRLGSAHYSLYWEGEPNPFQHGMTCLEVFKQLEKLLKDEPGNL